ITTANATVPARTWTGTTFTLLPSVPFAENPDFSPSRFVSPQDFVTGFGSTVLDLGGHGTHVSSTIGENTNNALAEAGLAYNVKIMPLKVCLSFWDMMFVRGAAGPPGLLPADAGGCPDDAIVSAIHYAADNGAKVINMSLGGPGTSSADQD